MSATAFISGYIAFKRDVQKVEAFTEDQLIQLYEIHCAEMRHYGVVPIEAAAPEPKTIRPMIMFVPSKPNEKKLSMPGAGVI